LSALWTLPWGVVTCLLMPFGLERLALVPMGWGIEVTIWVAQQVSTLPGNVWTTPRLPPSGLLLISFGGVWLCLWRGLWRRWGVVAIVAGFASMMLTRPPDIVIADIGRFVAARAPDGHYFVSADKGEGMARSFLPRRLARLSLTGQSPGSERRTVSTAPKRRACTRRMAARSRSSPARPRCRSNAAASTRSSVRCRQGFAAGR
jgi:Competence protein